MRNTLMVIAGLLLIAGAAGAQTFSYPTSCRIASSGQIDNSATIATPLLVDQDFRSEDLLGTYAFINSTSFNVNEVKGSYAEIYRTSFGGGGCVTDISTSIADQVSWSLTGGTTTMTISIDSLSIENVDIDRQSVTGTGVPITASNTYEVPQDQQLLIEIPFTITSAGDLEIDPFAFSRTDNAATTGSTVGAYQIFEDANSNCAVDSGDTSNIGSKGIVGPNSTYSEPAVRHSLKAGDYILVLSYFTDVDLAAFSPDCYSSPSSSGWHHDGYQLGLTLY